MEELTPTVPLVVPPEPKPKKLCKICRHPRAAEINNLLDSGCTYDYIVRNFNDAKKTSVHDHVHKCLFLKKSKEVTYSLSKDIEERLEALYSDVEFLIHRTKKNKKAQIKDIACVIGEGRKLLDSILKIEQLREAKKDPDEKLKKSINFYSKLLNKLQTEFPQTQLIINLELEKME